MLEKGWFCGKTVVGGWRLVVDCICRVLGVWDEAGAMGGRPVEVCGVRIGGAGGMVGSLEGSACLLGGDIFGNNTAMVSYL